MVKQQSGGLTFETEDLQTLNNQNCHFYSRKLLIIIPLLPRDVCVCVCGIPNTVL